MDRALLTPAGLGLAWPAILRPAWDRKEEKQDCQQ